MADSLDLLVRRRRYLVKVRIQFEPVLGEDQEQALNEIEAAPPTYGLEARSLVSRDTLLKFLGEITRAEPDGATVEVICLEPHRHKLRELLGSDTEITLQDDG